MPDALAGRSAPVRGVICSLLASVLFGITFYIAGVIDASPEALFGWRMVITAGCYAACLGTDMGRRALGELWATVSARHWLLALLVLLSALVGVQVWLFAWTPVHGHALDASLGYLLLPIALVLVGRIGFGEHVSGLQWIAVAIAATAVAVNLVAAAASSSGVVSWVTFTVCFGYALYFALRRRFRLDGPATFGVEAALTLPVAAVLIAMCDGASSWGGQVVVLVAGLLGAVAMSAYVGAARLLSMPVFGLLTYVEPVLLFVAALVLGERLTAVDAVVYALLAVALGVLGYAGFVGSGFGAVEHVAT